MLERDKEIAALDRLLAGAGQGHGALVFLGGEAGVGKTALVSHFCAAATAARLVAVGACDPLSTPRPLAPLQDVAAAVGIEPLLREGSDRDRLFRALLERLASGTRPTLLVFEDVHWADEATLDLLRYLGRRIAATRCVLVASYRDDEVGPTHPLRVVLGDLASSPGVRRLALARLSREAVRTLASGSGLDPLALHERTGGNAFYVTEVLAAGSIEVPQTVRDAVLARASRLDVAARAALEAAAVLAPRVAPIVLQEVSQAGLAAVEACLTAGMLHEADDALDFRHDLAREAVRESIPAARRVSLHRRALAVLRQASGESQDAARLAYHAEAAGDAAAVLHYALAAAQRAAGLHAHREAAAQYQRALRWADRLPPAEKAALLERLAAEAALVDKVGEAASALEEALAIWRSLGDQVAQGRTLAALVMPRMRSGRNAEAEGAARQAIAVLEACPPGPELAEAYRGLAAMRMFARDNDEALEWGEKAAALAERIGDRRTWIGTLNIVGAARLVAGYEGGEAMLEECARLAQAEGYEDLALNAIANLGSGRGERYLLPQALRTLERGIAWAGERDADFAQAYMTAWRAIVHLHLGDWARAADDALAVTGKAATAQINRIMGLVALGRLRARRGDPEVWPVLDEALGLAMQNGHLQRVAPVRAARAEAAWLAGDVGRCRAEAEAALDLALSLRHAWFAGELSYWSWRAGGLREAPAVAAPAFALEMRGEWSAAAREWERLASPYERARALTAGDEPALRQALAYFEGLGARPAAAATARRLRELGAHAVPRGPRSSTRANPAGLTGRELQVARLVAAGLRNAEIAKHLHLSTKTVGHHVSAVLTKLELSSRSEVARALAGLEVSAD